MMNATAAESIILSSQMQTRIRREGMNMQEVQRATAHAFSLVLDVYRIFTLSAAQDQPKDDSAYMQQFYMQMQQLCDQTDSPPDLEGITPSTGLTPMQMALICGLEKLADMLHRAGAELPPIHALMPPRSIAYLLDRGQPLPDQKTLITMLKARRYEALYHLVDNGFDITQPLEISDKLKEFLRIEKLTPAAHMGKHVCLYDVFLAVLTDWGAAHGRMPTALDAPFPLWTIIQQCDAAQQRWQEYASTGTLPDASTQELRHFAAIGKLPEMFEEGRWQSDREKVYEQLQQIPACLLQEALIYHPWLTHEHHHSPWQHRIEQPSPHTGGRTR